jgi:hypothetical protein
VKRDPLDFIAYGLLALAVVIVFNHLADRDGTIRRVQASADSLAVAIRDSNEAYSRQRHDDSARMAQDRSTIARLRAGYGRTIVQTDSIVLTITDSTQLAVVRTQLWVERLAAQELLDTLQARVEWADSRTLYWQEAQRATAQQLGVSQRLLREALAAKRPGRLGVFIGPACGTRGCGVGVGVGVRLLR